MERPLGSDEWHRSRPAAEITTSIAQAHRDNTHLRPSRNGTRLGRCRSPPQKSQTTLEPFNSQAPVERKMYSPSAKHAPHNELPFAFILTPNPPPASKLVGSADGKSKPNATKGFTVCMQCRLGHVRNVPSRHQVVRRIRQSITAHRKLTIVHHVAEKSRNTISTPRR